MEKSKMSDDEMLAKIMTGELSTEELNSALSKNIEAHNKNTGKLEIKFKNESDNVNPTYAKDGDSGFDLRANNSEPIVLGSLERAVIPTGLYFELPLGVELQVRPRSGLASRNGITVLNSPGTVDCVPSGTKISTGDSTMLVEDLYESDTKHIIKSYDETTNEIVDDILSDIWSVDDLELINITTEHSEIKIPKDKEVFTRRGWVKAKNLLVSDEILTDL